MHPPLLSVPQPWPQAALLVEEAVRSTSRQLLIWFINPGLAQGRYTAGAQKGKNPTRLLGLSVTNHVMFEKLSKNGASVINVLFKEKCCGLLKQVLCVS